jgi:peptidoglycan/xylan/chitin deacetylase (PgdA/CDA1 family)
MWHEVLAGEPASGGFSDYFAVSRHTFGRQLDAIAAAGYRGCSLAGALSGGTGPRVGITFDDGTIGHYERALPELVARKMTATFFVTTAWVGRPGYVTWDQLRAMRDAGMEIGSHTRTHPFLSELDAENVERELRGAREEIDTALGQRTVTVALPGGDAPRRALRPLLAGAGYSVVATSRWGVNGPARPGAPAWIRRCTVPVASRLEEFQRILDGDVMLSVRRRSREWVLGALRDVLGPTRYTRWRRRFLDAARRRGD